MFNKIYKNENKFGDTSDNFNFKVIIFLDKYKQVGLLANSYIQGIFIILLGQIQTYYYINCGNTSIFD